MWKLFLERMLSVMSPGGVLSVVLPSGILTNEGATDLRKYVLGMEIIAMYEFENQKAIFNIHRSYKFVMLVIRKSEPKMTFPAAFYLHDILALKNKTERNKMLKIPVKMIHDVSPDTLAIPEFRSPEDVDTMAAIYASNGRVGDGLDNGRYTIDFAQEINRSSDSEMFRRDGKGIALIEGKNFHQFIHDYTQPKFTILEEDGLDRVSNIAVYKNMNKSIYNSYRLTYRDVASATNMRTMIACIVPPKKFFANTSRLIIISKNDIPILNEKYYTNILYLVGVLNSLTFDYIIRMKTQMHLQFSIVKNTAIPTNASSTMSQKIINCAAKLTFQNKEYLKMAKNCGMPIEELDVKTRIHIMTKLDALVAHSYNLNREQYKHIISTFRFKKNTVSDEPHAKWSDAQLHAIYNAVQHQALKYYDRTA